MSDKVNYVPVEAWCGFEDPHPPHLWPELSPGWPDGTRINMHPCPGHRLS